MTEPQGHGQVHDLGYRKYLGERRDPKESWKVIARTGLRRVLRQKIMIVILAISALPMILGAGYLYARARFLTGIAEGFPLTVGKGFFQVMNAESTLAFAAALVASVSLFSDEQRPGALLFYFSRPVSRRNYLIGKMAPLLGVLLIMLVVPPLVLGVELTGLTGNAADLSWAAKGVVHGATCALALAATAAVSASVVKKRGLGVALFFGLHAGSSALGEILSATLGLKWLRALSIPVDMNVIGQALYRESRETELPLALLWLLFVSVSCLGFTYRRLARAEKME